MLCGRAISGPAESRGNYDFQISTIALCIVIVGGMGNVSGVLLGAFVMMGFNSIVLVKVSSYLTHKGMISNGSVLSSPNNWKYMIFGFALILTMRFRPEGLLPSRRVKAAAASGAHRKPRHRRRWKEGRMKLLSVQGLTIRFGGLTAVDDVSFEVEKGQIFSIIGPNGAGKTTVFNAITGVYDPTEGHILLQGKPAQRPFTVRTAAGMLAIGALTSAGATIALSVQGLWDAAIHGVLRVQAGFSVGYSAERRGEVSDGPASLHNRGTGPCWRRGGHLGRVRCLAARAP